jgi:hypothetical protein
MGIPFLSKKKKKTKKKKTARAKEQRASKTKKQRLLCKQGPGGHAGTCRARSHTT